MKYLAAFHLAPWRASVVLRPHRPGEATRSTAAYIPIEKWHKCQTGMDRNVRKGASAEVQFHGKQWPLKRSATEVTMPTYRLLVFKGVQLQGSETFEADGHLQAIDACGGRHVGNRMELWSNGLRIARLGLPLGHTPRWRQNE
jgi:hypothetical protein